MRSKTLWFVLIFIIIASTRQASFGQSEPTNELALLPNLPLNDSSTDWLLNPEPFVAKIGRSTDGPSDSNRLVIDNGLVRREFLVSPNVATVSYQNRHQQQLIRAVKPEAKISLNGMDFDVGGLIGQPNHAFLTDLWIDQLQNDPAALQLIHFEIGKTQAPFDWKRVRHHQSNLQWPPKGLSLRFDFKLPKQAPTVAARSKDSNVGKQGNAKPANQGISWDELQEGITVSVHYEMYDGVPTICKWIEVKNGTNHPVTVDRLSTEILALVEKTSPVEYREGVSIPRPDMLHVETDFAFGGFTFDNSNRHVVHFKNDPDYSTQVNYARQTPCLLEVSPTYGPAQEIDPGKVFRSYRTYEVAYDSTSRERRGLTLRRNYRRISPWVTENPIMHHLLSSDPKRVKEAIDEAAEVGFEMVILSFGSGFNMENDDPAFLKRWKNVADYADSRGIELGGYSLLSSRRIGNGNDIVSPEGVKPTHGACPALTSEWGRAYYQKLYDFFPKTGFDLLEHDGPYPGDVDTTSRPPWQKGEQDSRWVQWRIATRFYEFCRTQGVYLNTPDYYFLNGSNKCGMGYREVNWSLPRAQQVIHTRQNIFDGTWQKTPSMGWMFVPLSQYHGGGKAATIEPLKDHLDHYKSMLQCNFALGVQACFRGPRLFDSPETKSVVKQQVDWFKKYRTILEADLIHGRRADGRSLDWMLHVDPSGKYKGMLVVFNPKNVAVTQSLTLPLYYTGLSDKAKLTDREGEVQTATVNRDYSIQLNVSVPANGMSWVLIESHDTP